MLYPVLLAAVLLLLTWFVRDDAAEYAAFKALTGTDARQRVFRRWTGRSFVFFLVGSVIVLLLLGRVGTLWRLPPEFAGLSAAVVRAVAGEDRGGGAGGLILPVSVGLVGGGALGALLAARRRKTKVRRPVILGDIEPLFPRNAAERRWTALLAANAGPTEEIFFRLMLPLLFTLATGQPLAAFVASGLIFGAVHYYQGWVGIAGTTIVGALLAAVYLASGSIWLAVLLHSLMNLNSLWLRPWLAERGRSGNPG